jgi:uncharacterized protein
LIDVGLAILTVLGLTVFEMVSSIDNAVINADILATMSAFGRRWFLTWGMLISVFLVRVGLPFLIVFLTNPALGVSGILAVALGQNQSLAQAMEQSARPLLAAGGVFLLFLFFHWLFLEPKNLGLKVEQVFLKRGLWFYAVVSIILTLLVWYSIVINPILAFGTAVGSSMFFIMFGFRQNAEEQERRMLAGEKVSDWSKLLYLEVIDASFSIDGVLGAFAFTLSVLLIAIGSGIGAILVRELTARNIQNVRKYKYLKNGAMYSIGFLGCVMLANAFGADLPEWASPVATIAILSYFFYRSWRAARSGT